MPKVMIVLNAAWNLVNFRSGLIRSLIAEEAEVVAVAPFDDYAARLNQPGCRYVPLSMDNKGTHPGRDLLLLWRFYVLLRRERPDVLLTYTIKPNIYASLAAHALGIPVINNVTGLGAAFNRETWLTKVVRGLYKLAFGRSARVFFQNEDDRALFIKEGLVAANVTDRIPGSGIDLERFSIKALGHSGRPSASPGREDGQVGQIRFLLVARMLWDKGVGEYVAAARQIRQRHPNVTFGLLGFLEVQNPTAISRPQMQAWVDEGAVHYLGVTDDVRPHIAAADCVVLPSRYREGVPRTLLEAAAMGRPIITTDAIGCREVVEDGVNGFLCATQDAGNLAEKMALMISLTPNARAKMGRYGREKMIREFDEQIVIQKYLAAIWSVIEADKGEYKEDRELLPGRLRSAD